MSRFPHLFLPLALFAAAPCYAQHTLRDTSIVVVPITLSYAYQIPQGDMALRFEKAFGVDMDTLMRMQNSFDIAKTRKLARKINVERYEPRHAA